MKQFFEQYGAVALGVLALLVLIAMITPVGNIIKTSLQGTTNKFASSMNGQLVDAMVATAEAQEKALGVRMDRINKNGVVGDFSKKGNLVTIDGRQFRVLTVEGTQAKVMMMEDYARTIFNNGSVTTLFNDYSSQQYKDSVLDQKMIGYYNSLPETIQNSILTVDIKQSGYKFTYSASDSDFKSWYKRGFTEGDTSSSPDTRSNAFKKYAEVEVGPRKVYALDMDDVIEYLGSSSSPQDVNEMFWNIRSNVGYKHIWFRTAYLGNGDSRGMYIWGETGGFESQVLAADDGKYDNFYCYRPAFIIDLSLL